jgi:chromosome segregation ATPase
MGGRRSKKGLAIDVAQTALVVGILAGFITIIGGIYKFRGWLAEQTRRVRDMWRREREQRKAEITALQEQVAALQNLMHSRVASDSEFKEILSTLHDRAASLKDALDKLSSNALLADARMSGLEQFEQAAQAQLGALQKEITEASKALQITSEAVKESVNFAGIQQKDLADAVQANIALQGRVIDLEKKVKEWDKGWLRLGGGQKTE